RFTSSQNARLSAWQARRHAVSVDGATRTGPPSADVARSTPTSSNVSRMTPIQCASASSVSSSPSVFAAASASRPVHQRVGAVRVGNLLFVSGHGPTRTADGKMTARGKVGKDLSTEQGAQVARDVGLNLLATVRTQLGSLDKVKRIVKVLGMVNATEDFGE